MSLLLAAGTLLLLAGHALRALRHGMMLGPSDATGRSPLAFALFLSYAINAAVPLRAGDAFRAAYLRLARPLGGRLSLARSCGIVAAERTVDAPAVFLLLLVPAWLFGGGAWAAPLAVGVFLGLALLALRGLGMASFRRRCWSATAPFADPVRIFFLDLLWSWATALRGPAVRSPAFLGLTAAMWTLYAAACALLARAAGLSLGDVLLVVHGAPLEATLSRASDAGAILLAVPLVVAPVLLVLLLLPLRSVRALRAGSALLGARLGGQEGFSGRFAEDADYRVFLLSHFAGGDGAVAAFGLFATGDGGAVWRFLEGGSGAVVAVVDGVGGGAVVRKFAAGEAAPRLALQAAWLRSAAAGGAPVSAVLSERSGPGWSAFDMPLLAPCSDASEAVHAMPLARARAILEEILDEVRAHHARTSRDEHSKAARAYLEGKMRGNAAVAQDILSSGLGESWELNGERFSLDDIAPLLDPDWGMSMLTPAARACDVHGDLTLENIIVSPIHPRGWFLIDPNPAGPLERPLLDMGKLLQSLHLGYETLSRRRDRVASFGRGGITIPLLRSETYASLHALVRDDILRRDGEAGLREASFHEIVHWLRLVPYKARAGRVQGVAFAALVPLLLRRHQGNWGAVRG